MLPIAPKSWRKPTSSCCSWEGDDSWP
ncbi:hypothetical protein D3Y59_17805 (plasmid) [Hymenobacter oligotrophus]|uniref:Leucine-rich repeat-containing N-terminal plant-type domain-containing protein n=1 Tax=Hymenobacter oligotrophus TaxID=2319843 RepID=A0A3B7R5R8_9BACT|nr:hypothetical protein D3Y59_17805 [Hymenobacter oligotrophus]